MFIDEISIDVEAGAGGSGCVSFHRDRGSRKRKPDGGDGGDGGDVVVVVDTQMRTLLDYRYRRLYKAGRGGNGGSQEKTGRRGEELVLRVPSGTIIWAADGDDLIADLVSDDDRVVICGGGKGGEGNARSWRRPRSNDPDYTPEKGAGGQSYRVRLELKLLADVGLVGKPNAGKSTLLRAVSSAKPKVAAFPFTTREPVLGLVRWGEFDSFVVADIPGLIEGAGEGRGLGHKFLRHIERTRLILFLVEITADDPEAEVDMLRKELASYSPELAAIPSLVALNKSDLLPEEKRQEPATRNSNREIVTISGLAGQGVPELVQVLGEKLKTLSETD
ncbi:GTPase ObgE [candidate division KSB1 bacterium]